MPRQFKATFVDPAFTLWQQNQQVTHLAVHAACQMDILAEVVAKSSGHSTGTYKIDLCLRRPVMRLIWDLHDQHKHGGLTRQLNQHLATPGQSAQKEDDNELLSDHTPVDGPVSPFQVLQFTTADGTKHNMAHLLLQAHREWEDELKQLGI